MANKKGGEGGRGQPIRAMTIFKVMLVPDSFPNWLCCVSSGQGEQTAAVEGCEQLEVRDRSYHPSLSTSL